MMLSCCWTFTALLFLPGRHVRAVSSCRENVYSSRRKKQDRKWISRYVILPHPGSSLRQLPLPSHIREYLPHFLKRIPFPLDEREFCLPRRDFSILISDKQREIARDRKEGRVIGKGGVLRMTTDMGSEGTTRRMFADKPIVLHISTMLPEKKKKPEEGADRTGR